MKTKNIPESLDDAIDTLYSDLSAKDVKFIEENDHSTIHFFGGMQMRNNWHLWDKKSPINKDIQRRFKLAHGDDCSGLIFTGLWAKVRGEDVTKELKKCAARYTKHWRKSGVDPMTGKKIVV
jgi:hypothetical protein